jgi:cobalt/nickel transport system permease protein
MAMLGVHALIGIGEGLITAATVGLVLGVRPDLVYGARDLATPLELSPRTGTAESPS